MSRSTEETINPVNYTFIFRLFLLPSLSLNSTT